MDFIQKYIPSWIFTNRFCECSFDKYLSTDSQEIHPDPVQQYIGYKMHLSY